MLSFDDVLLGDEARSPDFAGGHLIIMIRPLFVKGTGYIPSSVRRQTLE